MPTLILPLQFSRDSWFLESEANKLGWPVLKGPYPERSIMKDPVVWGPLAYCDYIARKVRLGLIEPPNDWLGKLPGEYLGRHVSNMTLKDLAYVTKRAFIKPANDKVFPADIYPDGSFVPVSYLSPDCPIYVSDVVSFEMEVRYYVVERRVVTSGTYRVPDYYSGVMESKGHHEATDMVERLLKDPRVEVPPALTIDVGIIEDVGPAIIEANQLYASGVYMLGRDFTANPQAILGALPRASGLLSKVPDEDRKWLRQI